MWALAGGGRRLCCAHALRATPSLCSAPAFPAARAGWPGQAAAALSTAPAKLGPAEKSARAQARRDAEAAAKAEKKLLKRARYELAIAQPLLSDPRVCRLSLLDVPDYKRVKKGWKKGVVVSDKMDKTAKVLVERWGTAWNGKRVKLHTKYIAHDEGNVCRVGDVVYVSDSRPLSKTKHSVVQFNVGNPYELRDLDFDDPATIEAEDVRALFFFLHRCNCTIALLGPPGSPLRVAWAGGEGGGGGAVRGVAPVAGAAGCGAAAQTDLEESKEKTIRHLNL